MSTSWSPMGERPSRQSPSSLNEGLTSSVPEPRLGVNWTACVRTSVGREAAYVEQLKLPDVGLRHRGKNVQSDSGSSDRGKSINSLVAYGSALYCGIPVLSIPDLDAEVLHLLAVIEPFHDDCVVKRYGLGKLNFQRRIVRAPVVRTRRCRDPHPGRS